MKVEWKKLGDVCKVHTGSQLNRTDMLEVGAYPVVNGGREYSGFTDKHNETANTITISQGGESAGYVNWIDVDFWAGAHCYIIENQDNCDKRFLYHALKDKERELQTSKQGAGIPGLNRATLYKQIIPLPTLAEQARIVGILDTFSASIENLKEQIAQRRKQYEHYRDKLLDLEGKEGVEMKTLGEVCDVLTGGEVPESTIKGQQVPTKSHPFAVYTNGKETYGYADSFQVEKDAVCISSIGANTGAIFYKKGKFTPAIRLKVLISKGTINTRFLYYAAMGIDFKGRNTGSVPNINANYVKSKSIPLPSLQEQSRIVSILDTFEASIANLEAQLKERQKQYEYYRNKLLTFEE